MVAALRSVPGRVFALVAAILTVGATSTAVFVVSDHLPLLDAMYFTATTMATVGYGDINLLGAPDWLKIYDIGLMAVSAVLLASVLALITDMLVRTRIDRALGRFPRPDRDHVIVCGLGKAGSRILDGAARARTCRASASSRTRARSASPSPARWRCRSSSPTAARPARWPRCTSTGPAP